MPSSTFSDEYQRFITALVALRKSKKVRQTELALQLGKPQSYVSKYERGERRLDVAEFNAVVRALGEDPAEQFALASAYIGKK